MFNFETEHICAQSEANFYTDKSDIDKRVWNANGMTSRSAQLDKEPDIRTIKVFG